MEPFLTDEERRQLRLSHDLGEFQPTYPPPLIGSVMNTQFSIARHYGGVTFNGHRYTYFPGGDELIRDDVLKWVTKRRKEAAKAAKAAAQGVL